MGSYGGWQLLEPAPHKWLQPQDARLQVDHATPTDSGWGGHSEVLHFKHHGHCLWRERGEGLGFGGLGSGVCGTSVYLCEFDDLSAAEAKFLVVIQHSVHALNPDCIHWTIKHIPLLVRRVSSHSLPHKSCQDTVSPRRRGEGYGKRREWHKEIYIMRVAGVLYATHVCSPLMGEWIKLSIQLPHLDRLGIEHKCMDRLKWNTSSSELALECSQCIPQHFIALQQKTNSSKHDGGYITGHIFN